MKILVTGATGFMGTYFVPRLLKSGYQVRILVRDREKARKLFGNQCEIIVGNVENKDTIKGCCNDVAVVFHMAALMGHDSPSEEAFQRFECTNVLGTKNIVEEAKIANVKKFIYISSTAAMGIQKDSIIDESMICNPYTPYQVSKRNAELYLLEEIEKYNFPAIIIRPSMVYGPGFKGDFLTLTRVCKKGFFPKIGRGKNLSPALYITDLIEAFIKIIDGGKIGEIYLLSSKESYSLEETAQIIARKLNKKIIYIYMPRCIAVFGAGLLEWVCKILKKKPLVTKRNIQSVSTDRTVNISKLMADIDYEPQVSLYEGLPKTIDYYIAEKYI